MRVEGRGVSDRVLVSEVSAFYCRMIVNLCPVPGLLTSHSRSCMFSPHTSPDSQVGR